MRTIVRMRFGSHLYGTSTPGSDLDFKSVFIPDGEAILLQQAPKHIVSKASKGHGVRNTAGDVDEEAIALHRFFGLLTEGQPMAAEMLFAPDSVLEGPVVTGSLWDEIRRNSHRLISRKSKAFIGYAKRQANNYSVKGERLAAVRLASELLDSAAGRFGWQAKLHRVEDDIREISGANAHMDLADMPQGAGGLLPTWTVCDRQMPLTVSLKTAGETMERLLAEYGKRAQAAEREGGVDWKALSHAVRVGTQAVELFSTGRLVFPLANAEHLKAIKLGRVPHDVVSEEIEALVGAVEAAASASALPDEPDLDWMRNVVIDEYRDAVAPG